MQKVLQRLRKNSPTVFPLIPYPLLGFMSGSHSNSAKPILYLLLQVTLLVLAIEIVVFRLWAIDLGSSFPLNGDGLWFAVPVKSMIDNGWVYDIPQLSAPFGLSAAGFPSMTNFDWLLMKLVSVFTSNAAAVLHIYWLLSIVLTSWSAVVALHLLGARNWLALGAALVYAFLPYAFLRHVHHISLVYYTVPLLALLAIFIAKGGEHPKAKLVRWFGYGASVAQGFNYIYFSFFALLLFSFAAILGVVQNKSRRPIREAAAAILIILVCATLNLTPSFLSWMEHGKPPDMDYKTAAEAEFYGLKLRKMLAPHQENKVPFFSQWGKSDRSSNFPNENENETARLGPMAATGFLFMLMVSTGLAGRHRRRSSTDIQLTASLALFCYLFTTVGGFGAIFNQILADFRAYNRFSVFIAFFSLAGLVLLFQEKINTIQKAVYRNTLGAIAVLLVIFSLYDQLLDTSRVNGPRSEYLVAEKQEKELIEELEARFPGGVSVFQLPLTGFPPDGGKERMSPYDHARPYLWSKSLVWSWPSFSQRHRNWLDRLEGLQGSELAEALVLSKFGLVWIDRYGYRDNGDHIIASLQATGANEVAAGISQRYAVLDLALIAQRLTAQIGEKEFQRRRDAILNWPVLGWDIGFYGLEHRPEGRAFRWSRESSQLVVSNVKDSPWSGVLSFNAASGNSGRLVISSGAESRAETIGPAPVIIEFPLTLESSSRAIVSFESDVEKLLLPFGETRDLYFYVMDWSLKTVSE